MPAFPLVELSPIVIALVALGLAIVTAAIIRATLGKLADAASLLPGIGGWLRGAIDAVAAAITHVLGLAENKIDSLIGMMFHLLAKQFDWLWREFKRHTLIGSLLATLVYELTHAYDYLRHHFRDLQRVGTSISGRFKTLEKEYHGIEARVGKLERDWSKGIGHDLITHVHALEQEFGHVENTVIPSIRTAVNTAENDVTALRKWITANFPAIGTDVFTGAVAVALAALGLGGLRCSSFTNLLRKWGCGLGSLLDGLLSLIISTLVLEHVCDLLPVLETAFGDVAGPIIHLLTEVPLGPCEQPPSGWAQLHVPAGALPPAQTLGTLPT